MYGEVWHLFSFLGKLRSRYKCLKNGRFVPVSAAMGCVAYARVSDADRLLVIANNNPHSITYYLPEEWQGAECITGNEYNYYGVDVPANSSVILSGN